MSNENLRNKRELGKLKKGCSSFFDEETLPKVEKKTDFLIEELNKELAENKKIIEENDRIILEMGYGEEYLKFIQLTRLKLI